MTKENQECCPKFNVEKWDKKAYSWNKRPFIMESVPAFFHIPFTPMIGKRMTKMMELTEKEEANIPDLTDALVLFHDPSPFRSEIYYSVTKEVAGANNTSISGEFVSRVYEGPYNSVPRHMKAMNRWLKDQDLEARQYYVHYAYCPGCAKKYGQNYMILFAQVN